MAETWNRIAQFNLQEKLQAEWQAPSYIQAEIVPEAIKRNGTHLLFKQLQIQGGNESLLWLLTDCGLAARWDRIA